MDQPSPRGREVSRALTEIRTVLSRAETALDTFERPTEPLYDPEGSPLHDENNQWVWAHDPDHHQMVSALRLAVANLREWERTGPPAGTERKRRAALKGVKCRCCEWIWAGRVPAGHEPEKEG